MSRLVSYVLPGFQSRQCFLGHDSDVELLLQIGVATQILLS